MSIEVEGQVGPQVLADGTSQPFRMDRSAALVVSEAHGRYYETTFRKAIYRGANLAGVTTSAAFATTYTGCCLSNPINSSVNLVINKITYASVVAQTAALVLGIMQGFSGATNVVHTTPLVVGNANAGGSAGVGLLDSAATLPVAPTSILLLDVIGTAAITTVPDLGKLVDLEGSIIVPPGGFAAFYTSAASVASSLAFGFQWEEVNVNG